MKKKADLALTKHLKKTMPIALEAALAAGKLLKSKYGKFKSLQKKADSSFVTEADRGAEKLVVAKLRKHFPGDEILGEESGLTQAKKNPSILKKPIFKDFRWHIDPLDGTTNFVHALPLFCVSIGLEDSEGNLVLGVIHNPISGDTYSAHFGAGAKKNGKAIHVSKHSKVADAMLSTGFSYRRDTYYERELVSFGRVLRESRAIRRIGSAALDLAFVSNGYFEGFWERGLSSWDVAAGICILEEAGGKVSDFEGKPYRLGEDNILATNGVIHNDLLQLLLV